MTAYRLDATTEKTPSACGHIGARPQLPGPGDWPRCRLCDEEMIAFLELVLPAKDSTTFVPGSRLQVFACREHDDVAGTIYSDYTAFVNAGRQHRLPDEYWNITDGHYLLRLLPASEETVAGHREERLVPKFLTAMESQAPVAGALQLYGEPAWFQDPELHECSCGAPMELLLQVPEGYPVRMADGAPPQPNSFSLTDYCLFLGNQLSLFACSKQCHPHALWPVLQS